MTKRRVTQSDVAAIAGVSQATVSLILNDRTPPGVRIAEETRQRVLDAIAITGYTANPIAQRLAGGRNQILGVFTYESTFPRGGRDFYGPFLVGIEHAAEALGVDIVLFTSAKVIDGKRKLTRKGWQRLGIADGCLLLGQHEDQAELEYLLDINYPFVFIGRRDSKGDKLPYVGAEYVAAVEAGVDRLVELGHKRIGFAGSRATDQSTRERIVGYRQAISRHGLRPRFIDGETSEDIVTDAIDQGVTALMLLPQYDSYEIHALLAVRDIRVPEDMSVFLMGQLHVIQSSSIVWSGFSVPREEMGARALYLLSQLVAVDRPTSRESKSASVAGSLTGIDRHQVLECLPVEGQTVAPVSVSSTPSRKNG